MWPFTRSDRASRQEIEDSLHAKMLESQRALLTAASTTCDAAQDVAGVLRAKLEDSLHQFESTARLITDALVICDDKGRIRAFNPAAELIFATAASEIDRISVTTLFRLHGQPISHVASLWLAIDAGLDGVDPARHSPLQGARRNGEAFPIKASITRLDRQDGSALVLLLVSDFTDRFERDRIAEHHADRFQSLFDLSFDGILVTQNQRIVAANQSAAAMFAMAPESLLNTSLKALLGDMTQQSLSTEADAVRGDGTALRLLCSTTGITWNSQPAHLVTIKDVTEAHDLKRALQGSVKPGDDMICVFAPDFTIHFANHQFRRFYDSDPLTGRDIRDLLPLSERDGFTARLRSLGPHRRVLRSQAQHVRTDGPPCLLDWTDQAAFDGEHLVEFQRTGRKLLI